MSNCRNDTVILDAHDFELVDSVASDIRLVMSEANPDTDDNTLRRMSSILRRLVVYNDYGKAWRLVISEPKFPTLIAPKLVPELPLETGILFAGGAQVGGITIALAYIGNNYADLRGRFKKVAWW